MSKMRLTSKKSVVSQKTMDFFRKISHEILKISHVFWKTWEVFSNDAKTISQDEEDDFTGWSRNH